MIEVRNLTKAFDGEVVLNDINVLFRKGIVNMIIGKSGSGKTAGGTPSAARYRDVVSKCGAVRFKNAP